MLLIDLIPWDIKNDFNHFGDSLVTTSLTTLSENWGQSSVNDAPLTSEGFSSYFLTSGIFNFLPNNAATSFANE